MNSLILLHGLSKSSHCMQPLAKVLMADGYQVHNLDYPSTEHTLETLATDFISPQLERIFSGAADNYFFVTHSMGGILLRYLQQHQSLPTIKRTVLLAPPNQGSEIVDAFKQQCWYKKMMGPAGQTLGTDDTGWPQRLGSLDSEFGIVAGNRNLNPISNWIIDGPNDGRVSVERTKLHGMHDFIVLPYHHSTMMEQPEVIEQTRQFLKTGRFYRASLEQKQQELTYEN